MRGSLSLRLLKVLRADSEAIVLKLPPGFIVLSNALGGGLGARDEIAIVRVSNDLWIDDVETFVESTRKSLGLSDSSILFLTSVDLEKHSAFISLDNPKPIDVVITAGFSPPACIDLEGAYRPLGASTINVIVAVDEGLTPSGLADLFKLVIEAKSVTSASLSLKCKSVPFGTVTDAIAVASRVGKGVCVGILTDVGNAIAKCIRETLVSMYKGFKDVVKALEDVMGISLSELVEEAMEAYRMAPIPGVDEEEVRKRLLREALNMLSDPNVWCFILAARELDNHGHMGTLWRLPFNEYESDSARIVADEILGMALSNYVHGYRAVLAMYWIERLKVKGVLRKISGLPMFLDDIASAFIASMLSKVYTELLREEGYEL